MANVINRTTLEYLVSVNTPDYPEEEWIINPDLSMVQGVPRKYWKLDVDSVVPMSQEEKDAYDLANPVVIVRNHLLDGTPCFMYKGIAISTQQDVRVFTGATTQSGAKNFSLACMLMNRVFVPTNAIIRHVQLAGSCASDTHFMLKISKDGNTEIKDLLLPAGQSFAEHDPDAMLAAGSTIEVAVSGPKPIVNPVCIVEIHRRD